MAERDRRGVSARIDRTNHVPGPIDVTAPVWQFLRANFLSSRVFETYDEIIEASCEAWDRLIARPQTITPIGMRDWAHIGQP